MPATEDIYGGRSPRDLALYGVPDAARIVRVPAVTVRSWVFGRAYPTRTGQRHWPALVKVADREGRRLSFTNLVELHVLSVLRGKHVRVEQIRSATRFIRDEMGTEHPLADVDTHTDSVDLYVEYLGRLINASRSQAELRPLVERYLERIERDEHGLARRLFPLTRDGVESAPRLVVIDPARRFGRPVLTTADVETSIIAERFHAGDSTDALAADFGVTEDAIQEALRFDAQLRRAA